jgi:hypothetical protein
MGKREREVDIVDTEGATGRKDASARLQGSEVDSAASGCKWEETKREREK